MQKKINADVYHKTSKPVAAIGKIIEQMHQTDDGSHGLCFSSALPNEKDGDAQLFTECKVWGSQQDVANMMYAVAKSNPDFSAIISQVAIRIATDKLTAVMARKKDKTLIIPVTNKILKPGDPGYEA